VVTYSRAEAAERVGVSVGDVDRLIEVGILTPKDVERLSPGDVRRVELAQSLAAAGIPLDGVGASMRRGEVSLDFLDAPVYERFSLLSPVTFQELSDRSHVPVSLLTVMREAAGSAQPSPDDLVRDNELTIASFLEAQIAAGFRPAAIERLMRVQGESLRRIAETEADWWRSEVMEPAAAAGERPDDMSATELSMKLAGLSESAVLAMYHSQQMHAWTGNIIGSLEATLTAAGLHSRLERPPAMCFLDITGYTRLTQERGDEAAADLAAQLGRLVQRTSVQHGGRPVKWLGDGVMFHFPNPGPGVVAALDMVDGVVTAGLPPAHVGLHAGPVIFQEGDYYGATVNVASRIAEYARPGEVLVSQEVVEASSGTDVAFREIGPVELKGVADAMHLHAASRPS
jgi:class 3 adenylate cyclase